MSQNDFVLVYVIVPLVVAVGWLLWRGRRFLRDLAIYAVVVGGLLLAMRVGTAAWAAWDWAMASDAAAAAAPFCVDAPQPANACWM